MHVRHALVIFAACGLAASARADDCNNNGIDDAQDIYVDCTSLDLDDSGVPDECEIAAGLLPDCNNNGIVDWADIFGASDMCGNPVGGGSADCDNNGVPDECQTAEDCNSNGVPDACEIRDGDEQDADGNGVPDSCDLAAGGPDCNNNQVPDGGDVRRSLAFSSSTYPFAGNLGAPTFPIDVAVGDVTGDGWPDIVAANRAFPSGESIGVFKNKQNGTFNSGIVYNSGGAAEALALADLDGDGDLDIVIAQRINSSFPVTLMLNNGSGVFTASSNLAAGQVPIDVDAGDIDGDHDNDLVVADINGGKLFVLRNNGNATFAAPTAITIGPRPLAVKLADLDNDGDLDLVALAQTSAEVVAYSNTAGTFTETARIPMNNLYAATALSIADMNADGLLDVALALQYSRSTGVLINQGGLSFSAPIVRDNYAGNPVAITTGDFDSDGKADTATTLSPPWPNGPLSIGRGLGDGSVLAPTSVFAGYSALSLATGDFDLDGHDDIVSGIYQEKRIRVWLNRSTDAFSFDRNHDQVPDECDCPADFDNTGFVDTDDYDAFVHAFEAGGEDADFDHSGFVDLEDFTAFVAAFEAGC